MEIILCFSSSIFESLSFFLLFDSGCEKSGPFLLHAYLKDTILKNRSVFLSMWHYADA